MNIQIPSDLKYVKKVSKQIIGSLQKMRLDENTLMDIRLCIEEALINAIKHGNRQNKALSVELNYQIGADSKLKIGVKDRGEGFDTRKKGRGLCLIFDLMDEVCFNKKGNQITMLKYLAKGG